MPKTLVLAFSLFLVVAVGCTSDDKSEKNTPGPPSGANVPVAPTAATPNANLLAIQGSCKLGKVGPEDSAAGTVKIDGPKKGEFQGCGVLPPNNQGMVAFQARIIANVPGSPTLRIVAPGQVGTAECVMAKPTGVNYLVDASKSDTLIYVTKGINNSGCKIETTTYDAHHWKGKLTASLLPSKLDQGNTLVPVKAEWDLYF